MLCRPSRSLCRGGRIRLLRPSVRLGAVDRVHCRQEGRGHRFLVHLEARVEERDTADAAPWRARAFAGVGTHPMAPAVVASSISRPGTPRLLTPRPSRGSCRGGRTRPTRTSVYLGAVDRFRRRPEHRGRRCLVHLKAGGEEVGRGPTESEGVRGGRDASHGAGCCCLVHLEARKAVAVVASSILRPVSRRADTAVASIHQPWRRR